MSQRKFNKKRRIVMICVTIAFVAAFTSFFVVYGLGLFTSNSWLIILYSIMLPLFAAALAISVMVYLSRHRMLTSLRNDNIYRLGVDNYFYDYNNFSERVRWLRRINRNATTGFIVCFTTMPSAETSSSNPNEKALNGLLADYLNNILTVNPIYEKEQTAYCFYRHCFYIYSFLNLEDTHNLIELIHKEIYDIIAKHELKIFAQPHFGIAEILNTMDLVEAVDRASVARNYATRNFEDITFYRDEFRDEANQDEVDELQEAINKKELVVFYQPKFSLHTKKFIGCEALVRWDSPKYGLVQPSRFIKKAEIGGLIHEIDMYVFKQVIQDLEEQKRAGGRLLPVSVNFSLYEFYSPSFLKDIKKLVDDSSLNPNLLEIEITETTSQANTFMATSILKKLKQYGFKILMDDFGSGFSNIAHLNTLPIDTVKIDKSFVDGLLNDTKNREIVKFLIALCKTNELEVIAEGVDSKEEVTILEKANCDAIQGYYYSEPVPIKEYNRFLKDNPFEKKGEKKQ